MRRVQKFLSGIFLGGVLLGGVGTGVALVEYSSLAYAGEKRLGEENLVTRQLDYSMAPGEEEVWLIKSYWDEAEVEPDESVPEGIIRYEITYDEKRVKPVLNCEEDTDREEEFAEGRESSEEEPEAENGIFESAEIGPEAVGGEQEEPEAEESEEEESEAKEVEEMEPQVEEGVQEEPEAEESAEGEPEAGEVEEMEPQAGEGAQGEPVTEKGVGREPDRHRRKTLLHLNIRYTGSDFAVWMACKDEILAELKKRRIFSYDMTPVTDLKIRVNPRTMSLVHSEDSRIHYFYEQ